MHRLLSAPVLVLVLALSACGDDGGDSTSTTGGGDDGGMTLSITSPAGGDTVDVPFTVELESSEDLGTTEEGLHHVHIFFDGDDSEYMVVESDSVEITELPAGAHVINASLRNADHSAAGVETEVEVTVGGGGGDDGATDADDGGVDY